MIRGGVLLCLIGAMISVAQKHFATVSPERHALATTPMGV
jgi:hypothetical protein